MTNNPTSTTQSAVACVSYTDARAGIDWLVRTLGAEAREVSADKSGKVIHSEIWFGSGCVMVGSLKNDGSPPTHPGQGVVYFVAESAESVDAIHQRAVDAGATITRSLRDTDYGSHDFGCVDPEGNSWGFGTYAPK